MLRRSPCRVIETKSADSAWRPPALRMNTYAVFAAAQHVFRTDPAAMRPTAMCAG